MQLFTARFQRRIYLMRHADVRYFDETGKPVPPNEVDLSDEGRQQAEILAEELRDVPFDRVVTSDLPRTRQTADVILEKNVSESPRRDEMPALREIQPGRLAELPEDQKREAFLSAFTSSLTFDSRFLGGEKFGDFFDRVEPCFQRLIGDRSWKQMLIVAHGGVNRAILLRTLGLTIDQMDCLEQDPCCLNVLDVDDRSRMLIRLLNHTPYNASKAGMQLTTMEKLFLEYCGGQGF